MLLLQLRLVLLLSFCQLLLRGLLLLLSFCQLLLRRLLLPLSFCQLLLRPRLPRLCSFCMRCRCCAFELRYQRRNF